MATSRSQSVKCLDTSSGPKRFTFKSISQRIDEININVYKSLDSVRTEPKSTSFFLDSLLYWRELNTAEDFISFYDEMMPLVQTMTLILFHKEKIFSELICRVKMKAQLSLEPILMLLASLSRDILQDFLPFLERLTDCLVDLLADGGRYFPDILEQVFTSWQYIMMYLQRYLDKDVVNVLRVTTRLRLFENDYVQDFMAEAVSFLLRNSSMTELRKGMSKVILEVAESPSSVKKNGAIALLFHVLRGTSSRLHSRAEKVFYWLIDKSFLSVSDESLKGLEAVVEVATDVIKRLGKEVDHREFSMIFKCLFEEISHCISDGCLVHLSCLLSLLTTAVCVCSRNQIPEETLLDLVRLLVRSYIVPIDDMKSKGYFFEVLNGILELMLCLLDNTVITGDLPSIALHFAPAFKLKNSGISFVKRLLLKDPQIVQAFRCHIISAMDDLIEESPEEILYSMLKFFEGQGKLQPFNSLDGVPSEEALKICKFFKGTLCSCLKRLGQLSTNHSQSDASVTVSNLAVLWGVLSCYPHFQHLHDSASPVLDLIVSLDQLLETEADGIAGIPKSTWQSLLGAALICYHKLLLVRKAGLSKTSTFLRLAKRHKSSAQVLLAVAEFLDSLFGDLSTTEADASRHNIRDLDVDEAKGAISIFADNLGLPNKEIRMSTLRILSHYAPLDGVLQTSDEPPHKKLKTEDSGSCSEHSQSINVIDLLLSVEATPLSISTSRKIVNLISRLQKSLLSATIDHGYLPLVLNGIIGILHNRLGYLWQPASECLAVMLGKYKDLVWNRFVQHLGIYQWRFLTSSDQLVKTYSESSQGYTLVDCFCLFLAPDIDSTPCVTVINQLLKSLQEVHDLAESQSRQLIPLFFKFLGYADENPLSIEAFSCHNCSGREWRVVLKEWLNLLKLMRNVRSLYRSQVLKEVLESRFLDEIDSDIQLKVLDCLLNWKDDFLIPYDQHLKNLIISKNLREELTTWSVSKDSNCIQEGHRGPLIPILIRLLTPKVRNLKILGSRKHTGVSHRRAVLCFLGQLDVDELRLFFSLLLNPLLLNPLLLNPLTTDVSSSQHNCPEEMGIETHSSVLVKCSNSVALADLSWKKRYGFLHVAEDILRTFDEFHIKPFLNPLMRIVAQILESCMTSLACDSKVHDKDTLVPSTSMVSMPSKQYKDLRSLCLKIISFALNKFDGHDFGCDFWDTFFISVKPLIDSFKQEGSSSEKPSSLFSCFIAMSRSPTLVSLLDKEASLVPKMFSILTVRTASDAIISSVLNFVENLLILDKESDDQEKDPMKIVEFSDQDEDSIKRLKSSDQEKDPIKRVLLPHIPILIDCFHGLFESQKEIHRKTSLLSGKTELRIFKLLVKYINSSSAEQFVDVLLPVFRKKDLNSEECLEGLHIIKGILPVLSDKMTPRIPVDSDKTTRKILNAVNPLLVSGGLDLRLCICDILECLSLIDPSLLFLAQLLRELNAVSTSEIGELDYDTRIKAYYSIKPIVFSSFKEEHALTVLSHCVYDMSSDELILRQAASGSLLSFIEFAASVLQSNRVDCEEMPSNDEVLEGTTNPVLDMANNSSTWTKACIQRIIKKNLLQNIADAMRRDTSTQKEWISLLRHVVYRFHQVPALNFFRTLCSEDPEVDFFNNIVHLQIHRRVRALSRFRNAISAGSLAENITVKIFVPLFFNMMLNVKDGKGEHLRNECLTTLAAISGQLQWENYRIFLMRCFKEMKLKPDKGKIMIRLICHVLDMFHFFNCISIPSVNVGRNEGLIPAEGNPSAMLPSPESNIPIEIQVCLQKVVFPKVMKLLKLDSEKVNVNVSLAALKLLKLLPEETMESQLQSIIYRICNFLKNRLESIRDEARSALAACAKELGMERFYLVVKVLKATLKRGFELHVLGYTLNFILSKMLVRPSVGEIDYCLEDLLAIAENDILGDVAVEKEVDKIASKMKETRKNKSFETLKLISQSITFRTHALKLLSPIHAHLSKHLTPRTKSKLEQMLSHIALGLECNPSTVPAELFVFVYGLIEDGITEGDSVCQDISETPAKKKSAQESSDNRNTLAPQGSKNDHLIVVFALQVLHNRLKNMKLDKKDEQLLSMLDPFVLQLGNCLNSKYEDILSAAFRCLASLIKLPLPSLEAQADKIKILLLDIAQKSSNATNPLVQSCLKLLTVLLRSTRISLSHDQLHILIQFPMFIDLLTNPSPVALSLLKSIVGRKLVVHEIYDIILRVAELMVTSQSEPIRKKCSQILLQFLLDYRLSDKRLQQHIDFLLTNLNYEHSSGREAVLEMLHVILIKFPRSVVDNQAQTFFLHLVVALANEGDQKVGAMVSTVLRELIARISLHALNLILDYTLSWYMGDKQHLWSAAAQVLSLLVEILKKGFQKHITGVLQVARNIFTSCVDASNSKGFNFSNEPAVPPFWKEAYYSLLMLEAMLAHFPHLYFDSNLEDIWEIILKFLLHPHELLRNISSRLVALHFAVLSESGRGNRDNMGLGSSYLANPSRLFVIAVSLLKQLKAQLSDDDASTNLIIQNLVFSICNLHTFAKHRTNTILHEFWSALSHRDQSSYLEAFQLLGSSKAKDAFMLATNDVSKTSLEVDQSDQDSSKNLKSLLVAPILKGMGKIATEMEDVQMKIVFNCFRIISLQISSGGCQDYAFYLLIPLYKVCEGFIGKVVNDEIKQLAEEVRDSIQNILGVDNFVEVYNQIRKKLKGKRDKRKHDQKLIAVVNPMRHAKRKLRLAEKHRAHKKRKITSMKMSKWRR